MQILKQSTARTVLLGPFLDEDDGKTAETGLAIAQADIRLSKNGGNIAQTNNATGASHDELGMYTIPLDTTDTATLGYLFLIVHESGALPCWREFLVVTANVFDTFCSTDQLDVNLTNVAGTGQTAGDIAALITTLDTVADGVQTDLSNGTDGLGALKALIDTIDGLVDELKAAVITNAAGTDVAADIIAIRAYTAKGILKNVAKPNIPVLMVDSTDHVTPKTGLTVTATMSHDAGAFGAAAGAVTEIAAGWYQFDAAQADMNADTIIFRFTATDADATQITFLTSA